MAQPLNFGQLTYKQGMDTLVGAPVETYAKVGAELTDRYWKVRQGVADTKNALANIQTNDYTGDKQVLKDAQNEVNADFKQASESDQWHTAQGTLINSVSKINNNAGLKLVMASKQAKDKTDKDIDVAKGWSDEEKQMQKLVNERQDNSVKKNATSGLYEGGFRGIGLSDHINVADKIKMYADIAEKFKTNILDTTTTGVVKERNLKALGQSMGVSGVHVNFNGVDTTFNQFVESHRNSQEVMSPERITSFFAQMLSSDNELNQSMNKEHELELAKATLMVDNNGKIVKNAEGQVQFKSIDNKVLEQAYGQMPTSAASIIGTIFTSDQAKFILKSKPTAIEQLQITNLLKSKGIDKLENTMNSQVAVQDYLTKSVNTALNGATDDNTKSRLYSNIRTRGEIGNLSNMMGQNLSYSHIISESKMTELGSYSTALKQAFKEQDSKGSTLLTMGGTALVAKSVIEQNSQINSNLQDTNDKLTVLNADLNHIKSDDPILKTAALTKYGITDANKDIELKKLEDQSKDLTSRKAEFLEDKTNSETAIAAIYKAGESANIGTGVGTIASRAWNMLKSTTQVLDKAFTPVSQALYNTPGQTFNALTIPHRVRIQNSFDNAIQHNINFDDWTKSMGLDKAPAEDIKTMRTAFNEGRTEVTKHIQAELESQGMNLPNVINVHSLVSNDKHVNAMVSQIGQGILTGDYVGIVLNTDDPTMKVGTQSSEVAKKHAFNANNIRTTLMFGEGAYGSNAGQTLVRVDVLRPKGSVKPGTDAVESVGDVQSSYTIAIPTSSVKIDGLNDVILSTRNSIARGVDVRQSTTSLNQALVIKGQLHPITFDTNEIKGLHMQDGASVADNAVALNDIPINKSIHTNIGGTPLLMTKRKDGLFDMTILSNDGVTPFYSNINTKGLSQSDSEFIDVANGTRPVQLHTFMGMLESKKPFTR